MSTPCYYCELFREDACKVCIHGKADADELQANARDAARFRWIEENCRTEGGGHGFTIFVPVDHEDIGCGVDAAMSTPSEKESDL